jgi:hypothetical protein
LLPWVIKIWRTIKIFIHFDGHHSFATLFQFLFACAFPWILMHCMRCSFGGEWDSDLLPITKFWNFDMSCYKFS